ncbi:hypothetical protein BDR03DRAFT_951909 [Suillus americanus]|nr:hypothetical protein BDR03DRAFT_951909 [Suillus americanus]
MSKQSSKLDVNRGTDIVERCIRTLSGHLDTSTGLKFRKKKSLSLFCLLLTPHHTQPPRFPPSVPSKSLAFNVVVHLTAAMINWCSLDMPLMPSTESFSKFARVYMMYHMIPQF